MRRKRLSGVLLIITALIFMALPVSEADAAESASDFVVEGSRLVKYQGKGTDVSVPDTVETISKDAFAGNTQIKKLVLPESVKRIEAYAFWGCDSLESVVLGSGLTEVADYVFAGCKGLRQMTLTANIKAIGAQAFGDCVNLRDITIPAKTQRIQDTAFDGCANLTIHCEEGTTAAEFAEKFYEKQGENAEYEDVPGYSQNGTGDGSQKPEPTPAPVPVTPSGRELGSTHVVGNHAVVFVEPQKLNVIEAVQPQQPEGSLLLPEELEDLISNGKTVPKFTVIDGRTIADQAYYRGDSLQRIELPEGLTEIGQFSFARSALQEVDIPEGVTLIGYGAFYHCDSLQTVKLPESLLNVEPKAFEHTAWMERFLESGEEFLVSGGVLAAYNGKGGIVTVPQGVRVIAAGAFAGRENITGLRLPDSLRVIGEGAFENCTGLARVNLGKGVEQIKDRAFAGCEGLQAVTLPATVKEVGLRALEDIVVSYQGNLPNTSYEASATRLSNEAYRGVGEDFSEPGVKIDGISPAAARLEGAVRSYRLRVENTADLTVLEMAWKRAMEGSLPQNTAAYVCSLTDSSGIPLTKLGRSRLTVVLPVPENLLGQELQMITVDRNGQLEVLSAERVMLEGKEAVRFETNFLSVVGIYGRGAADAGEELQEVNVALDSFSAPPGSDRADRMLSFAGKLFGAALLLTGAVLFLSSGKRKKRA